MHTIGHGKGLDVEDVHDLFSLWEQLKAGYGHEKPPENAALRNTHTVATVQGKGGNLSPRGVRHLSHCLELPISRVQLKVIVDEMGPSKLPAPLLRLARSPAFAHSTCLGALGGARTQVPTPAVARAERIRRAFTATRVRSPCRRPVVQQHHQLREILQLVAQHGPHAAHRARGLRRRILRLDLGRGGARLARVAVPARAVALAYSPTCGGLVPQHA